MEKIFELMLAEARAEILAEMAKVRAAKAAKAEAKKNEIKA